MKNRKIISKLHQKHQSNKTLKIINNKTTKLDINKTNS